MTYLDTHVAVWLCAGSASMFSMGAKDSIESDDDLRISPAVCLEFQFLRERNRISAAPDELVAILAADFGVSICAQPFSAVSRAAIDLSWTRDPFDRFIVGQALVSGSNGIGSKLITADRAIRENYAGAIW